MKCNHFRASSSPHCGGRLESRGACFSVAQCTGMIFLILAITPSAAYAEVITSVRSATLGLITFASLMNIPSAMTFIERWFIARRRTATSRSRQGKAYMSTSNEFTKAKNVSALIVTKPSTTLVFASTDMSEHTSARTRGCRTTGAPMRVDTGISHFISSETAHPFSAPSNYVPMRYRRLWCHVSSERRLEPALPPSA